MKKNEAKTGRKCDYCPSKDASPLTLKNMTVVSSCESCYESGAFKNKPSHTPGPWIVKEGHGLYIEAVPANRLPVAQWIDGDATARLIAAAPDLLTAANKGLGILMTVPTPRSKETQNAIDVLCAAISKAEGK